MAEPQSWDELVSKSEPASPSSWDDLVAESKKDPGYVGEAVRGLKAGVKVQLPKMAGQALQFFGAEDTGKKLVEDAEARNTPALQESAVGQAHDSPWSVRGNVYEAATNAVPSLAPGAAGAAAGAALGSIIPGAGTAMGALVGYAVGSIAALPMFYGSQAKESYDAVKKTQLEEGKSEAEADAIATKTAHAEGAIEAGGEVLADVIPFAKLFKPVARPVAKAAGTLVMDALVPTFKQGAKTAAGVVGAEVATEMAQQAGEDYVRKEMGGTGPGTTWSETSKVIMPTAIMSAIPGMAGAGARHLQRKAAVSALVDPETDPETRSKIAMGVSAAIQETDPTLARNFAAYAARQIHNEEPIEIGKDTLYEGQQKLLPAPQPIAPAAPADNTAAVAAAEENANKVYADRNAHEARQALLTNIAQAQEAADKAQEVLQAHTLDDAIASAQDAISSINVPEQVANDMRLAHTGRAMLERMEKRADEDAAYAEREAQSVTRDAEIAQLGEDDRARTQRSILAEMVAKGQGEGPIAMALKKALGIKESTNAGTVRSDQGQPAQVGQVEAGGGAGSRGDLQQAPAAGVDANGAQLREAGGADRAQAQVSAKIPTTPDEVQAATAEHLEAARNLTRSAETKALIESEIARRANPVEKTHTDLQQQAMPEAGTTMPTVSTPAGSPQNAGLEGNAHEAPVAAIAQPVTATAPTQAATAVEAPAQPERLFGRPINEASPMELRAGLKHRLERVRVAAQQELDRRTVKVPPELAGTVREMAKQRWFEEGGKAAGGQFIPGITQKTQAEMNEAGQGRTHWVGKPVYAGSGMSQTEVQAAVEKALAGQPMGERQRRVVQGLVDEAQNLALTPEQEAEAERVADEAVRQLNADNWNTLSKEEQDAEFDSLFGKGTPQAAHPGAAAEGARASAGTGAAEARQEEVNAPASSVAAQDAVRSGPDGSQAQSIEERKSENALQAPRPALALEAPTEAALAAKQAQAETGNVEERHAAVRDRNEAILSAPEGTAPPRDVSEAKVPTAQTSLFGGAVAALRTAADEIEKAAKPAIEQTPSKPTEKIGDFGEKIGGARKDVWQSLRDKLKVAEKLDVAAEPLSKTWPEPDYQALIDAGADPWAVGFMHAARDEVPRKPSVSWKLRRWVEQVTQLRDVAMRLAQGELDVERAKTLLQEMSAKTRGMYDIAGRIELYQLVGHSKSLAGVRISVGNYSLYEGKNYDPPKVIWSVEKEVAATAFSNWPRQLATGNTKQEAMQNFKEKFATLQMTPPASKETSFDIFSKRNENGYWVGKKIGRNPILLDGPFKSLKEARAYKDEHHAELVAKLEKAKDVPNVRRDTNAPRVGEDMRNGQDVTPQVFKETFGFRGVEFGNWVEQGKRQQDLNDAFDALMDMAAVLGVPPRALSLNGELGLAFGARGTGGIQPAKAHYESGHVVINLTKNEGAGSLGHEWWHALDNYFSRMRAKGADFLTEGLDVSLAARESKYVHQGEVRKEMVDAFGHVVRAIRETAMRARSLKLDAKRGKDYWTTGREMSARAYESYLISKLQDQNASNDYLANIVDEATWKAAESMGFELDESYPYPTAGEVPKIRAAFDNFFSVIQSKETDKGVALFSRADQGEEASDNARAYRRAPGRYQALKTEDVRRIIAPIIKNWGNAPRIRVIATIAEAPEAVRRTDEAQREGGATGEPEAFIHAGTVYMVADGLASEASVVRALFHESFGHFGLRGVLGDRIVTVLNEVVRSAPKRVEAKAKEYGLDFSNQDAKLIAAEEVLAEIAQTRPTLGIVRRAVAVVRQFLRELGLDLNLSDSDIIANYILPAREFVTAQRSGWATGGTAFERSKVDTLDKAFEDHPELRAEIRQRARQMFGERSPEVKMADWVTTTSGKIANAVHTTRGEIRISLAGPHPLMSFNHEAFHHAMRYYFGLYEGNVLRSRFAYGSEMAKRVEQALIADGREDLVKYRQSYLYETEGIGNEEIVAFAFQYWVDGKLKFDAPVNTAFTKILDFLQRVATSIADALILRFHFPSKITAEQLFVTLHEGGVEKGARAKQSSTEKSNRIDTPEAAKTDTRFSRAEHLGTLTAGQEAALRNVHGDPETWKTRLDSLKKDWKKNLVQGLFDQYAPILDLSPQAYRLARMSKGGDSTLESLLMYDKVYVDKNGSYRSEYTKAKGFNGFAKVLASLHGEQDRFFEWVAALRAERLKSIGLENLYSASDIATLKTLNQGAMKDGTTRGVAYAKALKELNEWNDSVLKIAVDSGLIDEATRKMYEGVPYVPFYRLQEEGATFGMKAGLVNQAAWKKLKGGTAHLNDDLLANVLQNWSHLITASAKNRAAKATLEAAVRTNVAEEVPSGTPGKGLVGFKENGKERVFRVTDPHLMDAISAMDYAGAGPWSKPFSAMKRALTIGVTVNPAFKIRNLIRDSIQAIGTAELSYNPAKNIAQGYKAFEKESEVRAQLLAAGGAIRFGSMLDGNNADRTRRLIEQGVKPEYILDDAGKVTRFWKERVVPAFEAYQEFGDRGEQISRAALYEQLLAKGMSHEEASFWARDLMDFSLMGKWTAVRTLAQVVPFWNARLQGIYKLGRATKADYKRMGTTLGAVALSSIALLLAYGDDDDWKKREEWDRENFWWFKVGGIAFRIPKPFEIGAMGTLAERSVEYLVSNEMTGKRFAERMSATVFNQLSMNPTPQLVKPLMDLYANKDSFTDRPTETMGMEKLRKQDRATERTTELAKFLGSMGMPDPTKLVMGRWDTLSPVQIEALVRGYFGWLGSSTTVALDWGIRPMMDRGQRPDMQLRDVFLAGNFAETLPSNASRYVTRLYDQATEIEQAYGSYRDALKRGDLERAKSIRESEDDKLRQHGIVETIKRRESLLNEQARRIEASKDIPGDEKRRRLDLIAQRKNDLARALR